MTEKNSGSSDQPPFDESTQWSGPAEADPRDPVSLSQILRNNVLAPVTEEQRRHNVRAAEAALQELLDNPNASSEQVKVAMELLELARGKEPGSSPPTHG